MSVTLTDERYGAVMRAMRAIACGRRLSPAGYPGNIPRDELIEIARRACVAVGWDFAAAGVPDYRKGETK